MKVIGTAEATAVIADYFDLICDTDYAFDESEILRRMNANAIDAEPVRHGKWVFNPSDALEAMFAKPKCSECGFESADGGDYCSNCGARMDEE
jgi:hypothetical protein